MAKYAHLDDNQSVFFDDELRFIKKNTFDQVFAEFKYSTLLPVSTEAGPTATTVTARSYSSVGMMKLIASYAADLPRADVKAEEEETPIKPFGNSFGYNITEIRQSQKLGKNLDQRKADAARLAYEIQADKIAWLARKNSPEFGGLFGLVYNPNVTKITASAGASTKTTWLDKTADEILKDLEDIVLTPSNLTDGVETVDTVLLPLKEYGHIGRTRVPDTTTTILKFFLENNPEVTVHPLAKLKNVSPLPSTINTPASVGNVAIGYRKNPMKLEFQIPQPFEMFDPEVRGLEYITNCHARFGCVIVFYPLSVVIMEKI